MARPYQWATIKQYAFVKECIYDEWKPKEIANVLGVKPQKVRNMYRRLGLRIVRGNGCFKKGNIPHNAGTKGIRLSPQSEFKKGNTPKTTKPIGFIRVDKGIKQIKYSEHKWRSFHSHVWILSNGEIPKGHVVVFKKDADRENFTEKDLCLVSRAQLLKLNANGKNN